MVFLLLFSQNTTEEKIPKNDADSTLTLDQFEPIENDFYKFLSNEDSDEKFDEKSDEIEKPTIQQKKQKKNVLSTKNAFEPKLDEQQVETTKTFLTLYLDTNALTWTHFKLNDNNTSIHIDKWEHNKLMLGKQSVHGILDEMVEFTKNIPKSDTYIMEKPIIKVQNVTPKSATSMLYTKQRIASLVLLLGQTYQSNNDQLLNNFYFMPHFLMGRLYKLIIGNEITSTQKQTEIILKNEQKKYDITLDKTVREQYFKASSIEKEFLGRTLLLGLTFHRLAILRCIESQHIVKNKIF